ncbi:hypothetical protein [Streptomyces sp. NPDC047976]|uniref:hypothetical protein n=1 Tax=unclassified Streptomyces TaxID=2593676 RepID=UPI00344103EC
MKLSHTARVAVPILVAGVALPLTLATPATAAPTGVVTRFNNQVSFSAAAGANNQVIIDNFSGQLRVQNLPDGITAGPGCVAQSPTAALCGAVNTATAIGIQLRDQDDQLLSSSVPVPVRVNAGDGFDDLATGAGADSIIVRDGTFDSVDCGLGFDSVIADPLDSLSGNCERVLRY